MRRAYTILSIDMPLFKKYAVTMKPCPRALAQAQHARDIQKTCSNNDGNHLINQTDHRHSCQLTCDCPHLMRTRAQARAQHARDVPKTCTNNKHNHLINLTKHENIYIQEYPPPCFLARERVLNYFFSETPSQRLHFITSSILRSYITQRKRLTESLL